MGIQCSQVVGHAAVNKRNNYLKWPSPIMYNYSWECIIAWWGSRTASTFIKTIYHTPVSPLWLHQNGMWAHGCINMGVLRQHDGCSHSQRCSPHHGASLGGKGKQTPQRRGRFGPFFKDSVCTAANVQLSCAPLLHCTNCWYRRSRSFCDTPVKVWSNDSWWHFLTRWSVSKMWGDVSVNCVLQRKPPQNKTKKKGFVRKHRLFLNEIITLECGFLCSLCYFIVSVIHVLGRKEHYFIFSSRRDLNISLFFKSLFLTSFVVVLGLKNRKKHFSDQSKLNISEWQWTQNVKTFCDSIDKGKKTKRKDSRPWTFVHQFLHWLKFGAFRYLFVASLQSEVLLYSFIIIISLW